MKVLWAVTFLACVCVLTGCTKYWYQESQTFEECKRDRRDCFNELKKFSNLDEFGEYEFKFMEDCMTRRGYRLVTQDELPLRTKRQKPTTSLHWRLNGVAGMVEEE
ncbi:MAG: hypothetical protein ACYS4W_12220 [Planctomycetota bacterium]